MDPTRRFAELLSMPDDGFPLDQACLLIAAHARPNHPGSDLDIEACLARLDELAVGFTGDGSAALMRYLFGHGRFTGNTVDYYDPANSLLDVVLERRLGIPITLAVVALEVGRRAGIPLQGVGMPGHFLVRDPVERAVFFAPFHGPDTMDPDGCKRLYHASAGAGARFSPAYLQPVTRKAIVIRILTNLKMIHMKRNDLAALSWVMRLRATIPELATSESAERKRLFAPLN